LEELKWIFLNNFEVSSNFESSNPGTYITFVKGYDAGFQKTCKLSINLAFEKKN
jgi:hypothetical protein